MWIWIISGKTWKNTNVQHSVNTPFTYGEEGVKIFEKSLKGDGDFLVKMEGSPYKGVFYRGGASTAFQHMDFVAVMLFTQQVFHWECYFFLILLIYDINSYYFGSNLRLMLLLKVLPIKMHVFYSSQNEHIILPHEFIIGTILSKYTPKIWRLG